jgi:hypothetical protein
VIFQEFSNEERCGAAKLTLEGSLKDAGAKLRGGLEDPKSEADPSTDHRRLQSGMLTEIKPALNERRSRMSEASDAIILRGLNEHGKSTGGRRA